VDESRSNPEVDSRSSASVPNFLFASTPTWLIDQPLSRGQNATVVHDDLVVKEGPHFLTSRSCQSTGSGQARFPPAQDAGSDTKSFLGSSAKGRLGFVAQPQRDLRGGVAQPNEARCISVAGRGNEPAASLALRT
jgi:hypothetical protein